MSSKNAMQKSPARLLSGALYLLLCCFVARRASAGEPEVARVALTREVSASPFFVAIDGGFFKAEGLELTLTFLKTDAAVSAAVASGKADFGLASVSPAFYSASVARDLKVIASRSSDQTLFPMYVLLVSKKARAAGLSGVRGLPNKRIGVTSTESGEYYGLFNVAARFKLDAASIKTKPFNSQDAALAALRRGDIDAALLPFSVALHAAKEGESIFRLSDFAQWQQGVVFTKAETIATKRTLVERFMRAYQRGTLAYQLNFLNYDDGGDFIPGPDHEKYLAAIARQVKLSADEVTKTKTYCDRRANVDKADVQKQVKFWQGQGRLDKTLAAADLLDLSFIGEEGSAPR
jgi:NitT/TauT family transport system substrate-binding protein